MDCVLLLLRLRPPALCAPSFPKRLEEEKFLVFFFFFLRVALHHRVRGRFAKKRIQWLHYSWGKSLFIIGSLKVQEPTTQKKHTTTTTTLDKNPPFSSFFRSAPPSPPFLVKVVSTFTTLTRLLEKSAIEMCAKSTLKRGLLLVVNIIYGGVFSWCAPKLSLSSKR